MEKLKVAASSQPSTARSSDQSRKTLILQRQRILFSAFRADQYSDPDGYLASLGMVLEQYPNDVIRYVTDPRTGVQRHLKWPPTISEIVEACDNRVAELHRDERFRNWGKNDPLLLEAPRENRPTLEQMKQKYGENWGLTPEEPRKAAPAPSWDKIAEIYAADPTRIARLVEIADTQREASQPTDQHHEAAG
jgi:hypothetical protein